LSDGQRFDVVVHQQQVGIVTRREPFALRLVGAIGDLRAELALLALELEFLAARSAQEIGERAVVRELRHLGIAAVRTIRLCADPGFGPCTGLLCAAGVGRLGFFEAEFHGAFATIQPTGELGYSVAGGWGNELSIFTTGFACN